MSDVFFDADRAAGIYPPKGWGWKTDDEKRRRLAFAKVFDAEQLEPWIPAEAQRLGIKLRQA